MSEAMAEVMGWHRDIAWNHATEESVCGDCDETLGPMSASMAEQDAWLRMHVAREITKAGYSKPRVIDTEGELSTAVFQAFSEGENLVLFDGWRPWTVWETQYGELRVSSMPVEGDPAVLHLSDVPLPATIFSPKGDA